MHIKMHMQKASQNKSVHPALKLIKVVGLGEDGKVQTAPVTYFCLWEIGEKKG